MGLEENGNSAMDLTSSLYMKIPNRKIDKTTTKIGRLLFLRLFIAKTSGEEEKGVFLRGICMNDKEERELEMTELYSRERMKYKKENVQQQT